MPTPFNFTYLASLSFQLSQPREHRERERCEALEYKEPELRVLGTRRLWLRAGTDGTRVEGYSPRTGPLPSLDDSAAQFVRTDISAWLTRTNWPPRHTLAAETHAGSTMKGMR